jgi:hypothetical protein
MSVVVASNNARNLDFSGKIPEIFINFIVQEFELPLLFVLLMNKFFCYKIIVCSLDRILCRVYCIDV